MVDGLFAEKFVFFLFAFAESGRSEYIAWFGCRHYFRLVHIITVGNFELYADAACSHMHLRNERLFGGQQFGSVHCESIAAKGEQYGKEIKYFFHKTNLQKGVSGESAVGKIWCDYTE